MTVPGDGTVTVSFGQLGDPRAAARVLRRAGVPVRVPRAGPVGSCPPGGDAMAIGGMAPPPDLFVGGSGTGWSPEPANGPSCAADLTP